MIRALVCAAAIATVCGAHAQDLAKAQNTANQVCAACHAADGNSTAPANPKIAGQFSEYLHKQLADFKPQGGKKPARESAIMMPMVANLSEADMKGLAAFYAGQKLKPAAAADKDLARRARPEALAGRQHGDRRARMRRLPWAGRRRDTRPVSAPRGTIRGVHRSAAQGVQGRRAGKRSERHDARGHRSHDRTRDPRGCRVCGRVALAGIVALP
jgi:cytochrome c553